jgi:chromosome segregation ATPase
MLTSPDSSLVQAGFGMHNHHPTPQQTLQHLRSLSAKNSSTSLRKPSPTLAPRQISKSVSNGALSSPKPGFPLNRVLSQYSDADGNMSTLPDPRSRTPADESSLPPSPTAHPDLTSEVETLSNKLISAINHQTNLDDNLSATRQELSVAQERIKQLEQETSDHAEMMARGILIRKSVADIEKAKLAQQLVDERKQREVVEKEKKGIEQELENLTTALFEEANNVSSWSLCIN